MAQLGTLPEPVEPKWHQGLAADTRGGQRLPNATQIGAKSATRQHNDKHPSIQASMHGVPEVGGRGGSLFNPPHLVKR